MTIINNTGMESQNNRTIHSSTPNISILNATQNFADHLPDQPAFLPSPINMTNSNNPSKTKDDKALMSILDNISTVIDTLSSDLNPNSTGKNQSSSEQKQEKEEAFLMSLFESLIEIFNGLIGGHKEDTPPKTDTSTIKVSTNTTPENTFNVATNLVEEKSPETCHHTLQKEPINLKIQLALLIEFAEMVSNALEGRSDSEFSDLIQGIDQEFKQQEGLDSVMRMLADYAESKKASLENNDKSTSPSTSLEIPEETMTIIMELISDILQILESLGFVKEQEVNT